MRYVRLKKIVIIGITASLALSAGAVGTHRVARQAFATELRSTGISTYREAGPWRAEVIERELVGPDTYRTVRSRIAVRDARTYRVDMTEVDDAGRDVESTTVRRGDTVYSLTRDGNGRSRMHVLENVPPDLSGLIDNSLGQRVQDLAESHNGRALGRERVGGRHALKMRLAPDHFLWLDEESGLPCKEQYLAGTTLIHETEFVKFERATLPDSVFELPSATNATVVTEDLGFREGTPAHAAAALGFTPHAVAAPADWNAVSRGHIDGSVWAEGAPGEATWVELFAGPDGIVLVSQQRNHSGSATGFTRIDGGDSLSQTDIGSQRVYYHENEWMTHAFVQMDGLLVSFEAAAPFEDLARFIESVL